MAWSRSRIFKQIVKMLIKAIAEIIIVFLKWIDNEQGYVSDNDGRSTKRLLRLDV